MKLCNNTQSKINAGRYPGSGDPVPILCHTFTDGFRTKQRKLIQRGPMRGGSVAFQQASSP